MEIEPDESLYSRQLIMIGKEAMKKMATSSVFLSGLGGLGVEIAKNVALAGVKNLTLHDTKNASWLDLSTQFYISPADIGKNRAEISIKQISELNPYTKIDTSSVDLATSDLSFLSKYKCVVLTDQPLNVQIRVNEFCHSQNIAFISGDVHGVFGWTFCDFGNNFEIVDKDGEEPKEVLVGDVSKATQGVVHTLEKNLHLFEDGDFVTFKEVQGMTQLNGTVHQIKVLSPTSFSIGDTSNFPTFFPGRGSAVQVKVPFKVSFDSLKESLTKPKFSVPDFAKMDNPAQILLAARALYAFLEKHNKLPAPWNAQDATEVLTLARQINESDPNKIQINEDLVRTLSFTAQGSIVGLSAFFGGVISQEVLKALSGKYTPLNNWLLLDAVEIVPALTTNPAEFQPKGTRSDAQVICIGQQLNQKLADLKIFMIGSGAIGCEMLKNYAMLGVGCRPNGNITVTDNDLIEKSNLNRQFLFRAKDIQKPKSESAARAATNMNPSLQITANLDKVGPDTEKKYSDTFFEGLDIVVNALDNVNARLYVDSRCVVNKRPLLESGTLGPKGHVQVVIPFKTESYGDQRDPPEKDVPFCTLKSFPSLIEHCIEWARDFSFGGLFVSKPMQWNQLLEEKDLVDRLKQPNGAGLDLKVVRTVHRLLRTKPKSFEDCLTFGRLKFESYYSNKAKQLLHSFPLNHTVDDKGTLFWASPKRPPTAINFDWNEQAHRGFIIALAHLWAEVWGVQPFDDLNQIRKVVESVKVPPFRPKEGKKIETDEKVKKEEATQNTQVDEIDQILADVSSYFTQNPPTKVSKLKPIEFEKDDDTNHHIDFIAATANLRAHMYSIAEVDRLKIKAIAGRIMPAIATTTGAVSGLVCIELVKLAQGLELDKFKNLFMNLATPFWGLAEPGAAQRKKIDEKVSFTLWDRWDVKKGPNVTLGEFVDEFEKNRGLQVSGVFKGALMIYVPMFPGHIKRKPKTMTELLKRKDEPYIDLIVTFSVNNDDVSAPPVRIYF